MSLGTIVLVPGLGGSELSTQAVTLLGGHRVHVWMNPAAMVAGGWRLLGLAPDGITSDVAGVGELVPGPPLRMSYQIIADQFRYLGWDVISPALDWRQTIATDGRRLAAFLEENRWRQPMHLLCHSRGGLVARSALDRLKTQGKLYLVGKCAGMGVPHQGSWSACGLIAEWVSKAILLDLMLVQIPSIVLGASPFGRIDQVTTTWPSVYELFPRPSAEGISADQWTTIYDPLQWLDIDQVVAPAWLLAAKSGWAALPDVPQEVDWIDCVGYGSSTPDQLLTPHPPSSKVSMSWTLDGDGTVPTRWATQFGRQRITSPTGHEAFLQDGRVFSRLHDWFLDLLNEDVLIEGTVLP